MIVELFALIPSLLLVQLFQRLQSRQKSISSIRRALYQIKPSLKMLGKYLNTSISYFLVLVKKTMMMKGVKGNIQGHCPGGLSL